MCPEIETMLGTTALHGENSDVLPFESVAVAVMKCPTVVVTGKMTVKLVIPLASVEIGGLVEPRYVCPSPKPEESQAGFE